MAILKALLLLALPLLVLAAGGWALGQPGLLGAARAPVRASESNNCLLGQWSGKGHLNMRVCGYGVDEAAQQWHFTADETGRNERSAEIAFLEYDLIFPFVYGGALLAALLLAWIGVGRPFSPAWLLAPVVAGVFADWVENLIHLDQINRYANNDKALLSSGWLQIASCATSLKLLVLTAAYGLLVVLVGRLMVRALSGGG